MTRNFITEDGIVVGEIEDKSNLSNPIARLLVHNYDKCFLEFIERSSASSIHEVGCGTGRLAQLIKSVFDGPLVLSDFSQHVVSNHTMKGRSNVEILQLSVYDLKPEHSADLIVCCEMLEHLEAPERALEALKSLRAGAYLFSVPREPIWRILNMARFKYLHALGNTPGHLQHWSAGGFVKLLESHGFMLQDIRNPLPWTMVYAIIKS